MKVWVCYEDGGNSGAVKVVDSEEKAQSWMDKETKLAKDEKRYWSQHYDYDYQAFEVE